MALSDGDDINHFRDDQDEDVLLHTEHHLRQLVVELPPALYASQDVQPDSYHALHSAYNELKNRYNELHDKYRQQVQRQSRRGSLKGGSMGDDGIGVNHMYVPSPNRSPSPGVNISRNRSSAARQDDESRAYVPNNRSSLRSSVSNGDLKLSDESVTANHKEEIDTLHSQLSRKLRTNELLERKVVDLEQQNAELVSYNAQLRQSNNALQAASINSQSAPHRNSQHILQLEAENEDLRKNVVALQKRLQKFKVLGRSWVDERQHGDEHAHGGDLNMLRSQATSPRPPSSSLSPRRSSASPSSLSSPEDEEEPTWDELEDMSFVLVSSQEEVHRLKETIWKQNEVIRLLIKRYRTNSEPEIFRQSLFTESMPQGAGARPKMRPMNLTTRGGNELQGHPGTSAELTQPMQCVDDVKRQESITHFRRSSLNSPHIKNARSQRWGSDPGLVDSGQYRSRSVLGSRSKETNKYKPSKRSSYHGIMEEREEEKKHDNFLTRQIEESEISEEYQPLLRGVNINLDTIGSHYDNMHENRTDLGMEDRNMGTNTHVEYGRRLRDQMQMGLEEDDPYYRYEANSSRLEDTISEDDTLLPDSSPLFQRHDSPSPHDASEYDDIYVGEGNNSPPETMEHMTLISNSNEFLRNVPTSPRLADRNNRLSESGELENRYRVGSSQGQPRPLNIDRNQDNDSGATARSYDNTVQNVNLNVDTEKFGPQVTYPENIPILNNDPLVGNKTIPSKNIYRDEEVVRSQPGSRERHPELRGTCPVCNEEFPASTPLSDFENHVSECGIGSPQEDLERVCPMCNSIFPDSVPQLAFEEHVNGHFPENDFEVLRRP